MVQELRLPELGENIDSAVVSAILVSPGEAIRKDQSVIEVETDKATAEVPSPFEGVVKEIHAAKGKEIHVGELILTLDAREGAAAAAGEQPEREPSEAKRVQRAPSTAARAGKEEGEAEAEEERGEQAEEEGRERKEGAGRLAAIAAPPRDQGKDGESHQRAAPARPRQKESPPAESVPAAPAVRRLARELGIDIAEVAGTGARGRISAEDVTAHARGLITRTGAPAAPLSTAAVHPEAPSLPDFERWGPTRREPLGGVHRKTAEQMSLAWSVVPHVTQCDQADITELEEERRLWAGRAEAAGSKLTLTAIALKVAATALRRFPRFNASLDPERQEIIYKSYVHVGVAVDAGHGLLVPVVRDADRKNVLELAVELAALAQKARDKKLSLEEMRGGSFTISNLGALGTTYFSPIVNWPEVAILGIGRAARQPVEQGGSFVPRLILPLSLSYDHRLVDGAQAARFLRWIAEALEHPFKLVLEG